MRHRNILFIRSDQPENTYGPFAWEILKAEGLMGFEMVDLAEQGLTGLTPGDLAVFTRCFLTDEEIDRLIEAIENGASVVCLQPPPRLMQRLGAVGANQVVYPGYVKMRTDYPGVGLPIQTHLPVALWALDNSSASESPPTYVKNHQAPTVQPAEHRWEVIADALTEKWDESSGPAVVQAEIGQGRFAAFFYDLAESVARIRFGNPDLASYATTESWPWVHAGDMFVDHVDERLLHLPQADLHGQLLAKVLCDACPYPLPRLWYYEDAGHRCAAVFQSDGDHSQPDEFDQLAQAVEAHGATATFYLMKTTHLSEQHVAALRSRGHTFGPHVDPRSCNEELVFSFARSLGEESKQFEKRFGQRSATLQCHCAPWNGYMSLVPVHVEHGYRLLFSYMSTPIRFWGRFMCGSGRAMKFFGRDGMLHDCWQQPLNVYDDVSVQPYMTNDLAQACADFDTGLRAALDTHHSTMAMLSHPLSFCAYSSSFIKNCLEQLSAAGVPIYNADQWLDFIDRRARVQVAIAGQANGKVQYLVTHLEGDFSLMIPAASTETAAPAISINGQPTVSIRHYRLNQPYDCISLQADDREELCIEVCSVGS